MSMPADLADPLPRARRPIIGVPTQNLQSIGGVAADIPPSWVMSQRYVLTLTQAGGLPWMIPLVAEDEQALRGIYQALDGIFLPGGADIDPASYGAERHPSCDTSDPARDRVELKLLWWALEDRKPTLGVCRGLQLINLAAGGTIYQHLSDEHPGAHKHDYFPFGGAYRRDHLAHTVRITAPQSRLARIFGSEQLAVNSMHHQGVRTLGQGLVPTAVASDGLIEALEGTDEEHFLVAVQWHPEALTESDAAARRLFEEFITAAAGWRDARAAAGTLG